MNLAFPDNKVILVIDDNPEYRDTATAVIGPVIPQGWEVVAPNTLAEAIDVVRSRVSGVRIIFLDYRLNSNGYQPLMTDGITYENVDGLAVGRIIRQISAGVLIVGFSAGKNHSMRSLTSAAYNGKSNFVKSDPARQALRVLIADLVAQCDNGEQ